MRFDPLPLNPDSPTARDWVERELSKGIYRDERGLIDRFIDWLIDFLNQLPGGAGGLPGWIIWLACAFVLVIGAVAAARTLRTDVRRTTTGDNDGVLGAERLTAAEYRARAQQSLADGDASAAVLDAYRAIVAAAIERTLLDDLPGQTAHEIALTLSPVFATYATGLATAADTFDAVRYGKRGADRRDAQTILDLDAALLETTPALPELAWGQR